MRNEIADYYKSSIASMNLACPAVNILHIRIIHDKK